MQNCAIFIYYIGGPIESNFCKHSNLPTTYKTLKYYKIIPFLTTKPRDRLIKLKTLQDISLSNNKAKG